MRRGPRRKLFESDYLRARAWYWGVRDASGLPNSEAMEHVISPLTFRPRGSPSGGFIYPGYFSKIKNGQKSPGRRLINRAESLFPGTRYWFDHPFWDVIRHPSLPARVDLIHSKPLQSKYASALLNPHNRSGMNRHSEESAAYNEDILRGLDSSGDLDSLTAAILFMDLIKHGENHTRESADYFSGLILNIFTKVTAAPPFWDISKDLFKYLNKHFIDLSHDNYWAAAIKEEKIGRMIGYNRGVLRFFDDLGILTKHTHTPSACLEVIEQHIDPVIFGELIELGDREKILELPMIKSLIHDLRAWEQSALQPLAPPYA